jgi:hypothetical protein
VYKYVRATSPYELAFGVEIRAYLTLLTTNNDVGVKRPPQTPKSRGLTTPNPKTSAKQHFIINSAKPL